MQQTVAKILDGQFDYERGSLEISVPRIELTLSPGEVYTGFFELRALNDRPTEGFVSTDDIRMTILTERFEGASNAIEFSFASKGLEEGDVVQGEIYIVSNQGEYYLPYVVSIQHKNLESSLGGIKNLFHFANLAKANWDEACKLFYSDGFINVFTGNDKQYKKLYKGLLRSYGNEQNVEEFLLEINKKNPVEYVLEREMINLSEPDGLVEEYINITRNGWGYTLLNVETDADFVILSKLSLDDKDFLGNYLSYAVQIDASKLHAGNNFGKITFFNSFTKFSVMVLVNRGTIISSEFSAHMEYDHLSHDMMVYYEAFRTKKISKDTWIAETDRIVERLMELSQDNLAIKLFKAQLLMSQDRYNEAKWLLDQAQIVFEANEEYASLRWAYYLYLTTLYNRDERYIDEMTKEVEKIYQMNPSEWRVAWMLLYMSEEFTISPSKKWVFIEQQLSTQCKSPMFYVEAANMLQINPGLLTKLSEYEIKVLRYMADNELITDDIMSQFVYLAGRVKNYNEGIYQILVKCYEMNPSLLIVEPIVEMLIKGGKYGPEYYEWFLLAVKGEIRATKLYEYYMASIDLNKEYDIPKMVYLYFSYQLNLEWEQAAYLFARVIGNKDEMPEIYQAYADRIREFAIDSILLKHINQDAAIVVRFALEDMPISDELAQALSEYIFMHKITVHDEKIKKIAVFQYKEEVENVYQVENGVVYAPIYNKEYSILFEDSLANRYTTSVKYDVERLMVPGKIASRIQNYVTGNIGFDVFICENSSARVEIDSENEVRYQAILDSPVIDRDYKLEILGKLMAYYYDNDRIRELDSLLDALLPEDVDYRERIAAITFMNLRGMYDKVLKWLTEYGIEGTDVKEVLRLVSRLILRGDFAHDTVLLKLAATVFFKSKYDENIVKYLATYYEGMTKNVRRVFSVAEGYQMDISSMCERMLTQILYTGYYVPERISVYRKFVSGGGSLELQVAFLTQCSFEYFVKDQITDSYIFEELTKLHVRGTVLQTVCKLAYLKFYAESGTPTDETKNMIIKSFLEELVSKGIYMSFFKEYFELINGDVDRFSDKTIIEYKTDPGKKVWIHYIIEGSENEENEYVTEEMKDMYGGVHAKYFVLFFGEKLLYYITEVDENKELLTESGSIQKSDISNGIANSRFSEINDIVVAESMRDYDTANSLIYEYERRGYMIENLFELL